MNWEEYLEDSLGTTKRNAKGDEIIAKVCPFCEGGPWKFYVNIDRRRYRCYRGRSCDSRGDFYSLVQELEGLPTKTDAIIFVKSKFVKAASELKVVERLLAKLGVDDSETNEVIATNMPSDFECCRTKKGWRIPKYIKQRGITKASIVKYGIGFCSWGRYRDRMIIPVRCDGSTSFVARDMTGKSGRKYLNPSEVSAGRLLFNYDNLVGKEIGMLCVVEGAMDSINLDQLGYYSVGLLGKSIRWPQIDLILCLDPDVVVMMLDSDAHRDAIEIAIMMSAVVDVRLCRLGDKDPGEMGAMDVRKTLRMAKNPTAFDAVESELEGVQMEDWYG